MWIHLVGTTASVGDAMTMDSYGVQMGEHELVWSLQWAKDTAFRKITVVSVERRLIARTLRVGRTVQVLTAQATESFSV